MTALALSFNNTNFDVIDQNKQPWLRLHQIGVALGYSRADAVNKIYQSNSDEFNDSMTALVELDTSGGKQQVRIFSLRGCHLLAMFARTNVAKEFRKWVLDVLEQYTQAQYGLKYIPEPPAISKAQQGILFNLVAGKADSSGKSRAYYWSRVANHFKLASYKDLPADKFDEAHEYLRNLEGEEMLYLTKAELEAKVKAIAGELLDKEPDLFLTDSGYRKEARDAINQHLDTCHADMKAAGVEPPKWPVMDEKTIAGLAASALFGQRWIASFDHHTIKPHLTHVPDNAFIMTEAQFIQMLKERGFLVIKKRDVLQKLEA